MSFSFYYKEGTSIYVYLDSYFYKTSYGEGKGWPISKVYDDEHDYFTINRVAPLNRPCPYHISGKYGDLGQVSPSAIKREVAFGFSYDNY